MYPTESEMPHSDLAALGSHDPAWDSRPTNWGGRGVVVVVVEGGRLNFGIALVAATKPRDSCLIPVFEADLTGPIKIKFE